MKLDSLKYADIQKLKSANDAGKKANKDAIGKLATVRQSTSAVGKAIESESKELESTDE
ncbi:MAG: hypothetical protein JNN08_30450 [Bryobacterales bacterium]|nr:hypothetical protein [Bryobacterales bacterium]